MIYLDTDEKNFDYLEKLLDVALPSTTRVVALYTATSGVLVGLGHYTGHDCEVFTAGIGKRPPFRTAFNYLCWYAFEVCKVERITAKVLCDNEQSLRLMKILGFVQEGIIRKGDPDTGKDLIIFGIIREDYG